VQGGTLLANSETGIIHPMRKYRPTVKRESSAERLRNPPQRAVWHKDRIVRESRRTKADLPSFSGRTGEGVGHSPRPWTEVLTHQVPINNVKPHGSNLPRTQGGFPPGG